MDNSYFWSYSFRMKKGLLDNDYYFYKNGKILHVYDRTITNINIEEFISSSDISEREKQEMIENCPPKYKDQIKDILSAT